jgi:hypothetical protein
VAKINVRIEQNPGYGMLKTWACDGIGIRTGLRNQVLRVRVSPCPPKFELSYKYTNDAAPFGAITQRFI